MAGTGNRKKTNRKKMSAYIRVSILILLLVVSSIIAAVGQPKLVPPNPIEVEAAAYSEVPLKSTKETVSEEYAKLIADKESNTNTDENAAGDARDDKSDNQRDDSGNRAGDTGEDSGDNNSGNSGEQKNGDNNPDKNNKEPYFTTNLHEETPYSSATAAFKMLHHNMDDTSVKQIIFLLDGKQIAKYTADKGNYRVQLKEGENTFEIRVTYQKKNGGTREANQTFHLEVLKNEIVIQSSLKKKDGSEVNEEALTFTALAKLNEEEVPLKVVQESGDDRQTLEENGDKYQATLKEGDNVFTLTAKYEDRSAACSYTITQTSHIDFSYAP